VLIVALCCTLPNTNICTTLLEFLEMSGNLAKVSEKSGKRSKVGERSENLCNQGNLIVAAEKITYRYLIGTVIHFSYEYVMFVQNLD